MKRLLIIGLIPLFLLSCQPHLPDTYKVDRVVDGDTIVLDNGERVRYIGIDTPETKHPRKPVEYFGKDASVINKELVEGKWVRLEYDVQKKDNRGAQWVYAYLDDVSIFYGGIIERQLFDDVQFEWWQSPRRGQYVFINATIIKGGYATPVRNPPNVKYADLFEELYWEAKEKYEGLWDIDWEEVSCTKEGGGVWNCAGCVVNCCKGLMPMFEQIFDGKCQKLPVSGSGGFCSDCGNNICESKHLEDPCNCPEDCK